MSLVSSMNAAQQALSVNQAAITVVSNNIANIDTPGYSKMRVNMASVANYTPSLGNVISLAESCSGVQVASITRYSDTYLQNYYWQENSTSGYLNKYASLASNVEDLVNELDNNGVSQALTSFYSAANALSNDPSDITARENFVTQAQNVCDVFNAASENLTTIRTNLVGDPAQPGTLDSSEISGEVNSVNSLLDQIAGINQDIIKTNSGSDYSSTLLDKRDSLVTQLKSLVTADVKQNNNNTVSISISGYKIIDSVDLNGHLKVSSGDALNPATISIIDKTGTTTLVPNINNSITSGSIGAVLDIGGSDPANFTVYGVMANLDTLASTFASELNKVQTTVIGGKNPMCIDSATKQLTLSSTTNFLFVNGDTTTTAVTNATSDDNITAANIKVNLALQNDPYLVAAARVTPPATVTDTGNNANMTLFMNTRTTNYAGTSSASFEKYLSNMIGNVGTQVENLTNNANNEKTVLQKIDSNLQSAIGVNLDEELVDLMKYQRAYQAASRVFDVCNQLMENLVNLGK